MQISRLRNTINRPTCQIFRQKSFSSSSSSSSLCSSSPKPLPFYGNKESEPGSAALRLNSVFSPPDVMQRRDSVSLSNKVSFIGSVDYPPKVCDTDGGEFGVHTFLSIHTSCSSPQKLRIGLRMWDKMAEISLNHLKQDDLIYVSGQLESYRKSDMNGNLITYYSVNVKDLNYARPQRGAGQDLKKSEKTDSTVVISGKSSLEKHNSCLRLWQVFFANPYEWWDNRKIKKHPKAPDFKHKDTKEALWINPDDPPWLKKQLQLHDSKMAEQGYGFKRSDSQLSKLKL